MNSSNKNENSDVYVLRSEDDEKYWIADLLKCWETMEELSDLTP
jgi:hypothetical protein